MPEPEIRQPGRIFNITRFLITNLISLEFTLFAICLSFSSPPLHKNLPFYSPLFFRSPFSCRICFCVIEIFKLWVRYRYEQNNVGFRVPAKPLRFEHWGAHEDFPLPNHALNLAAISKPSSTNTQHKRHKIYTGSDHRCGVIPYSSVVWWIASWVYDEQYKGRTAS